jgi:hypothetical protein
LYHDHFNARAIFPKYPDNQNFLVPGAQSRHLSQIGSIRATSIGQP